jgi:hypothetical protein
VSAQQILGVPADWPCQSSASKNAQQDTHNPVRLVRSSAI